MTKDTKRLDAIQKRLVMGVYPYNEFLAHAREDILWLLEEIKRLQNNLIFWAGEGEDSNPLVIEYRRLMDKSVMTKDDEARLSELAKLMRIAVEDEPELRERIDELEAELADIPTQGMD